MSAVKYEVWGRKAIGKARRVRLRFNLASEADAKRARQQLMREGYADVVLSQRPASDGQIKGLQKGRPTK